MVTISKENVSNGDRVYDIVHGEGTVVDTMFNQIVVRLDNGVRISFDSTGHYGGVRRLYWHHPVIVEPPKNKKLWEALINCCKVLYDYMITQ